MDRTLEYRSLVRLFTSDSSSAAASPPTSSFASVSQSLRSGILNMQQFILRHSSSYLFSSLSFSSSCSPPLSDKEREKFELEINQFIQIYNQKIEILRSSVQSQEKTQQVKENPPSAALNQDLQLVQLSVCDDLTSGIHCLANQVHQLQRKRKKIEEKQKKFKAPIVTKTAEMEENMRNIGVQEEVNKETQAKAEESQKLSGLELQELVNENHLLRESFQNELNSVQEAEKRTSEIARMVEYFASKVIEQEETVNNIIDNTISASVQITSGVEQLKKASKKGVEFRLIILFIILVLAFSLLFLDWYM
jgi:hypothetical protein